MKKLFSLFIFIFINITFSEVFCNEYHVAFRHRPDNLSPLISNRLASTFTLWQLAYPLFFFEDSRQLNSKILDLQSTKSINNKFNSFQFCLKQNVKYSSGAPVTDNDLLKVFIRLSKKVPGFDVIKSADKGKLNCVLVTLNKPDLHFFEKLTGLSSSIHKFDAKNPMQLEAVGDYYLSKVTDDFIILKIGEHLKSKVRYQTIRISVFNKSLTWENADLNYISGEVPPPKNPNNFSLIIPPEKKSYAIIVNLDSASSRKCFSSIINPLEIKNLLHIKTKSIPGFIPGEMLGSNEFFKPNLNKKFCKPEMKFTWYDFRIDDQLKIKKHFHGLGINNSVQFEFKFLSLEDLIRHTESGNEYIAVASFNSSGSKDAWNTDSSVFFEPFISSQKLISRPIPNLKENLLTALKTGDFREKAQALKSAHRLLLDSFYIYPLGELDKSYYYPKNIEKLSWADRASGIPLISETY